MNLFFKELKFNRKSLIIWCTCIGLLLIVAVYKEFSMMALGDNSVNEVMANFPKVVRVIFGFGDYDISKIEGYYAMMSMYIFIIAGIHAGMLGAGILAKEETDKTFEFLHVKPISRNKILTTKFLACVFNVLVLNSVTLVVSMFCVRVTGVTNEIVGKIILLMFGMFLMQLIFVTLGLLISSVCKRVGKATTITAGVVLITFFIAKFVELNENKEFLQYITPFKYFDAGEIMFNEGIKVQYIVISIALIIVFLTGAYRFYKKKDLMS